MKEQYMSEPVSSAAAAAFGAKALGGAAGAFSIGAVLATVVVMLKTLPGTGKEWAVGIISTVIASLAGGAAVTIKFGMLTQLVNATNDICLFVGLVQLFGVVFACGLPGWAIVRAVFLYIEKNRDKDIGEIAADVKARL